MALPLASLMFRLSMMVPRFIRSQKTDPRRHPKQLGVEPTMVRMPSWKTREHSSKSRGSSARSQFCHRVRSRSRPVQRESLAVSDRSFARATTAIVARAGRQHHRWFYASCGGIRGPGLHTPAYIDRGAPQSRSLRELDQRTD